MSGGGDQLRSPGMAKRALLLDEVSISRAFSRVFLESADCCVTEVASVWNKTTGEPSTNVSSLLSETEQFHVAMLNLETVSAAQTSLVAQIRASTRADFRIVCTIRKNSRDDIFSIFEAGADLVFTRPFDPQIFIDHVRRFVFDQVNRGLTREKIASLSGNRELIQTEWLERSAKSTNWTAGMRSLRAVQVAPVSSNSNRPRIGSIS